MISGQSEKSFINERTLAHFCYPPHTRSTLEKAVNLICVTKSNAVCSYLLNF